MTRETGVAASDHPTPLGTRSPLHFSLVELLESSRESRFLAHEDGVIVYANPALLSASGLDHDSAPYLSRQVFSELATRDFVATSLPQANLHGTWRGMMELRASDGASKPVHLTLVRFQIGGEFPAIFLGTLHSVAAESRSAEDNDFGQTLLSAISDVVHVYDITDGRSIYSNRSVAAVLGFSAEECEQIGSGLSLQLVHPEDLDAVIAHRARLSEAKKDEFFECTFRAMHSDGTWRWLQTRDTVYGEGLGLGRLQDVTDAQVRDAQMRQSEIQFRQTFRDAAIGMAVCASDGRFLDTNPAMAVIFGHDAQQLSKLGVGGLIHWEDLNLLIEWIHRVMQGESVSTFRNRLRANHADGRRLWLDFSISVTWSEGGQAHRLVAQIVDVSEQVRAEQVLNDTLMDLRNAQALTHVGNWSMDPDGTTHWSDETYRILGYEPGSFEPSVDIWNSHVLEEDRASHRKAVKQAIAQNVPGRMEYGVRRADGEVRIISSFYHPDAACGRMAGTIIDVTDHVRLRSDVLPLGPSDERLTLAEAKIRELSKFLEEAHAELDFLKGNSLSTTRHSGLA